DTETIRHLYFRDGWSIRKCASELQRSRKTGRKALQNSGPWEYQLSRPRPAPKVGLYRDMIRQWLIEDQTAPRKQRHTARRIYLSLTRIGGHKRLVSERCPSRRFKHAANASTIPT